MPPAALVLTSAQTVRARCEKCPDPSGKRRGGSLPGRLLNTRADVSLAAAQNQPANLWPAGPNGREKRCVARARGWWCHRAKCGDRKNQQNPLTYLFADGIPVR